MLSGFLKGPSSVRGGRRSKGEERCGANRGARGALGAHACSVHNPVNALRTAHKIGDRKPIGPPGGASI
jgi:hypothetical protein